MKIDLHKILLTTEHQQVFFENLGFKKDLSYEALNKDEVFVYQ